MARLIEEHDELPVRTAVARLTPLDDERTTVDAVAALDIGAMLEGEGESGDDDEDKGDKPAFDKYGVSSKKGISPWKMKQVLASFFDTLIRVDGVAGSRRWRPCGRVSRALAATSRSRARPRGLGGRGARTAAGTRAEEAEAREQTRVESVAATAWGRERRGDSVERADDGREHGGYDERAQR